MRLLKNQQMKWILREDAGYIYNYETRDVKVLNRTGSLIIQLCETYTVSEIVYQMARSFVLNDLARVEADVQRFLEMMIEEGYLCVR